MSIQPVRLSPTHPTPGGLPQRPGVAWSKHCTTFFAIGKRMDDWWKLLKIHGVSWIFTEHVGCAEYFSAIFCWLDSCNQEFRPHFWPVFGFVWNRVTQNPIVYHQVRNQTGNFVVCKPNPCFFFFRCLLVFCFGLKHFGSFEDLMKPRGKCISFFLNFYS